MPEIAPRDLADLRARIGEVAGESPAFAASTAVQHRVLSSEHHGRIPRAIGEVAGESPVVASSTAVNHHGLSSTTGGSHGW